MAVVIPFILPTSFQSFDGTAKVTITRIVSLHNPIPAFQGYFDQDSGAPVITSDSNLARNSLFTSIGFPNSDDTVPSYFGNFSEYLIPTNAYAVDSAAAVYGNSILASNSATDASSAVVLIDVTVAPVEPGFSRVRVDYQDIYNNPQTQYFDMPFWEGWDVHPREIQTIIDYMEDAFGFLDAQLTRLWKELAFLELHQQVRGLTVSGGITATQATSGIGQPLAPHTLPVEALYFPKFEEVKDVPNSPLPATIVETILGVSPSVAYPGATITVTIDVPPSATDKIVLLNTVLPTTVNVATKTLTAVLPKNLPFTVSLPLFIANNKLPKSLIYYIKMLALPKAYSFIGSQGVAFGTVGDAFTITGRNFTSTQGTVTFTPNIAAVITSWGDASIVGTIPSGAQTGPVTITVGSFTTALNFSLRDPSTLDSLEIQPNVDILTVGQTLTLSALFNGVPVNPTWSIVTPLRNIGAGNPTYGTITPAGLYTAPSQATTPFTFNVVANYHNHYGSAVAEASMAVLPSANTGTIAPTSAALYVGYSQRFAISQSGIVLSNVDWYVNGVLRGDETYGTITDSGLYQAPPMAPTTKTIYVTGVGYPSGGGSVTATAVVRIQQASNFPFSLSLTHSLPDENEEKTSYDYTCQPGATITVGHDTDTSVLPPNGCGGCVEQSYQWTAPTTPGVYTIHSQGTCYKPSSGGGARPIGQPVAYLGNPLSKNIGSACIGYANPQIYTVNVLNPQPAAPQLTSIGSACPGQRVTVVGKYFPSDIQAYVVGSNELMPMVNGSLSTTNNVDYTFNVTIPTDIPANAQGLQVYVKGSVGQSNVVPFVIPAACAAPPASANFLVSGPANVCSGGTAQFRASFNGTDVTTQCVWTSNGSGAVLANDGVFHAPSTTGTYTMNAAYQGYSNGTSIIDQFCQPNSPSTSACDNLTVLPANPVIYIPNGQQQFTAYLQIVGGSPSPTTADQWLVNDIPGGNSVLGTVTPNGLYTAPVSSPGFIHIKISATKQITKTS
jgi:hypothetical protein